MSLAKGALAPWFSENRKGRPEQSERPFFVAGRSEGRLWLDSPELRANLSMPVLKVTEYGDVAHPA
jgi:hypothetical protein